MAQARRGWSRGLRERGSDPDPRFTLANERTYLAWVRTALGLVAAGVALRSFLPTDAPRGAVTALAVALVLLGAALAGAALRRWYVVEAALREGAALPYSLLLPAVAAVLVGGGLAAALLLLRG